MFAAVFTREKCKMSVKYIVGRVLEDFVVFGKEFVSIERYARLILLQNCYSAEATALLQHSSCAFSVHSPAPKRNALLHSWVYRYKR